MHKDDISLSDNLVVVGRVRRAWGLKGQLSVDWSDGSCPVEIGSDNIFLRAEGERSLNSFVITDDHPHGKCNIISLKGLRYVADAQKFRGSNIWVEKERLPVLGEGEYYTYELIGMRVETVDGEKLGRISEIFQAGGSDVYVVKDGDKELLIPATKDAVKRIDVEGKLMIVEEIAVIPAKAGIQCI